MAKQCQWDKEECNCLALKGEKYCTLHRKAMIVRMEADGYLQPLPRSENAQFIPYRDEENDG